MLGQCAGADGGEARQQRRHARTDAGGEPGTCDAGCFLREAPATAAPGGTPPRGDTRRPARGQHDGLCPEQACDLARFGAIARREVIEVVQHVDIVEAGLAQHREVPPFLHRADHALGPEPPDPAGT